MELLKSLFKTKSNLASIQQPYTFAEMAKLFDIFYVCFDEPNRGDNWKQIKSLFPKAQKIEGVVGFDNALKVCGKKSKTKHFFLIDGDNRFIPERFHRPLFIPKVENHWVLSWCSLNKLNGLAYGNGGLKLWPKQIALQIKTHENASNNDDQTDYCFIADYYLVDDFMTETLINSTPRQAFRAGFREGVKMSLDWGRQTPLNYENFEKILGRQNRQRLKIWCEVGADMENGYWAILGARLGLKKNAIEQFDYQVINSYDWIDSCLKTEVLEPLAISLDSIAYESVNKKLCKVIEQVGDEINSKLPLNISLLEPQESLQFKKDFINPARAGLLKNKKRK